MRPFTARALIATTAIVGSAATADAVEPTAFERFATDVDTMIVAPRAVGSLTSVDATIGLTVFLAVARDDATERSHGVRFDLRNNGGTEHVYLDRPQLERLLTELDLMELGKDAAANATAGGTQAMSVLGTESCWMPRPVLRILCPEVVRAPAWTGLRLWTFGGAAFEFRERTSAELRVLVERAVTELNRLERP